MRKLIDSLIVAGAIGFGTIVALALVFLAAGVIDKPKVAAIGDILAGRRPAVTPTPSPSATPLPLPPASQLRSAKILADARAAQEEQFTRRREELDNLEQRLETLAVELENRRKEVEAREKKLTETIASFLAEQTAEAEARQKAGFKDSLKVFEAMRPEEAGKLLSAFDDEEVVMYLKAFEPRFAARVLSSIAKSAPEGEVRAASLQMLLSLGGVTPQALPELGKVGGES